MRWLVPEPAPGRASSLGAWIVAAVVAGVVLAFCLAFAFHSWSTIDYGMLVGFSWRVWNGKVPYRDFLYVRTPLTLYLHSLWFLLPDGAVVRASRVGYYLQFAAAALLPTVWALKARLVPFGWRLPFLAALFCVLAIHNFPILPWYTVDAVLFSSLGLTLAAAAFCLSPDERPRRAIVLRAAASTALFCAAMCKQNFGGLNLLYAIAAAVELALSWRRSARVIAWVRFAAVVLPPLVLAALFAAWLLATGAWQPFVGQVLFASQASDVKTSGVEIYLVAPRAIWMVLLGLATGLMPRDPARSWARWAVRVPGLAALGAIAWTVRAYALEPAYGSPMGSLVFLLLCGGLVGRAIACALGRRSRRDLILLVLNAGLVAVAWSSAISWGYKTPLLGLVAMGLVLHELLPEEQSLALDVAPAALAAGLVVVSMWRVNELKPYRDVPVAQQSRDLGEAFPRLRGIKTNDFTFARYAEAKALIERWALPANRPFIVVHEYPEIHWLMDQQSPLGIDWLWPNDYRGNEPRLLAELDLARPVVLMMREADSQIAPIPGACPDLRYSAAGVSGVARRVLERGRYLGGGQFFCVYSMD